MHVYTQLGPAGVCDDASMSCFPQSIRTRDQTAANLYASNHNILCCCLIIGLGARRKVNAQSVRYMRRSWERPVCSTLLVRLGGSEVALIHATGEAISTTMHGWPSVRNVCSTAVCMHRHAVQCCCSFVAFTGMDRISTTDLELTNLVCQVSLGMSWYLPTSLRSLLKSRHRPARSRHTSAVCH